LTDLGRSVLDDAAPRVAAADGRILGCLAANKRESFLGVLRDLAKAGEKVMVDSDIAADASAKKKIKATKAKPEKVKTPKPEKKKAKKDKKVKKAKKAV